MNVQNLIKSLQTHRNAINDQALQKIDFDQLEGDLSEAVDTLSHLKDKRELCEKLLSEFKVDIQKMAMAVSRAKGEINSCSLVERLLSSPDLGFEDLLFLRDRVREEFNQSFPASPQSSVMVTSSSSRLDASEFRSGVMQKQK
jgi:hypothetical protein